MPNWSGDGSGDGGSQPGSGSSGSSGGNRNAGSGFGPSLAQAMVKQVAPTATPVKKESESGFFGTLGSAIYKNLGTIAGTFLGNPAVGAFVDKLRETADPESMIKDQLNPYTSKLTEFQSNFTKSLSDMSSDKAISAFQTISQSFPTGGSVGSPKTPTTQLEEIDVPQKKKKLKRADRRGSSSRASKPAKTRVKKTGTGAVAISRR